MYNIYIYTLYIHYVYHDISHMILPPPSPPPPPPASVRLCPQSHRMEAGMKDLAENKHCAGRSLGYISLGSIATPKKIETAR